MIMSHAIISTNILFLIALSKFYVAVWIISTLDFGGINQRNDGGSLRLSPIRPNEEKSNNFSPRPMD